MDKKVFVLGTIITILDQIIKFVVTHFLSLGESIKIIINFFSINYVNNYGGAWSLFNNQVMFLVIVSFVILFLLIGYMYKFKINKRNIISFGLLFGGILGNLIDRVCFGYVKDYLAFKIFNYNFPVFNLADIAIVVGVFLMGIAIIKGEDKDGNSSK